MEEVARRPLKYHIYTNGYACDLYAEPIHEDEMTAEIILGVRNLRAGVERLKNSLSSGNQFISSQEIEDTITFYFDPALADFSQVVK